MAEGRSHHQPYRKRTALLPTCPACGAFLRPALPQPLVAALLLTRTLTPRERTVFHLLGFGYDNRSIARELKISERTVKRYVTAILTKLELRSRLQAGLSALIVSSSPPAADAYWPEGLMDSAWAAGDDVQAHDTGGDHDL
jgi:DNA-binding CsgD family transcriptional regulator